MQTANEKEQLKQKDGQEYCINYPDGICIAIAGPGTGKTYAIAHRIKTIIKNGAPSNRILCLTFTDTASKQMQQGIKKAFIEDGLDTNNLEVNVCTFHSFCMEIIKNNINEFELRDGVKVISNPVARMFIKKITDEIESDYIKTDTGSRYQYINAVIKGINEIKKFNISKTQFEKNVENSDLSEKEKNKTRDLWRFYEKYEYEKNNRGYIDFSDMVIKVVEKFEEDKGFLEYIATQFDYILVDEYQDTNPLQNKIVYSLAQYCPNIFVVGDDDQTIYSFQGAKITTMKEYIEHFENLGKEVDVVTFNNNRRSCPNIVDVSRQVVLMQKDYNELIKIKETNLSKKALEKLDNYKLVFPPLEHDEKFKKYKIDKKLNAINPDLKNNVVECFEFQDEEAERYAIVEKIKELKKTVPLSEIAVLAKTNTQLEGYAELLKRNNIDFELKEGGNIFEINSVNILISYLEFLINPDKYSAKLFNYLLSPVFDINAHDYTILFKNRAHDSIIGTIKKILNNETEDKFIEADKMRNFIELYEGFCKKIENINKKTDKEKDGFKDIKEAVNLEETILLVINETGILDYYYGIKTGRVENLLGLKKFVEEARGYREIHKDLDGALSLHSFLNYIDDFMNEEVKICIDKPDYKLDAVQLSTIHSSKGKEYKYVFILTINRSKWESLGGGGIKINVPFEKDRNLELRLACEDINKYEKKWLIDEAKYMELIKLLFVGITRAKEGLYLSYADSPNNASVFIKALKKEKESLKGKFEFFDNIQQEKTLDDNAKELYEKIKAERYDYAKDFKELIDMKIKEIESYSPTSLNGWLLCRRRFLLEYVLSLGLSGDSDIAEYGSAIHDTLDKIVKDMIHDKVYPTIDKLKEYYLENINKMPFSPDGKKEFGAKGEIKLNEYYKIITTWDIKNLYKSEEKIKNFEIENEKFTGKIDRIDRDDEGNYIVYDYKTGSEKSANDISKNGKYEGYYNQIAFYKYLIHKKENIDIDKIRTIFLFPDKGTQTEVFISKDDCIEVMNKYFDTIKKIKEHNFEKGDTNDKEKTCKFCSCKAFCNP